MNDDKLKQANEIKEKIKKVKQELKIWNTELTSNYKLGYVQSWNGDHAAKLNTNIPKELFDIFRSLSIDSLKLQLVDLEKQFSEL